MPRAREKTTENPLKQIGANKARTRESTDRAGPGGRRARTLETATRQGGSTRGGGRADTSHPSQRGGLKHGDLKRRHDETDRGGGDRRQSQRRARLKTIHNVPE